MGNPEPSLQLCHHFSIDDGGWSYQFLNRRKGLCWFSSMPQLLWLSDHSCFEEHRHHSSIARAEVSRILVSLSSFSSTIQSSFSFRFPDCFLERFPLLTCLLHRCFKCSWRYWIWLSLQEPVYWSNQAIARDLQLYCSRWYPYTSSNCWCNHWTLLSSTSSSLQLCSSSSPIQSTPLIPPPLHQPI